MVTPKFGRDYAILKEIVFNKNTQLSGQFAKK